MTIFGGGETMMIGGVQPNSSLPSEIEQEHLGSDSTNISKLVTCFDLASNLFNWLKNESALV